MAIKLSGPLSFDSDIVREFISDNAIPADFRPHSLSEYYRLGGIVPDATANDDIPLDSSVNPLGLEEIKFSDFYGAVNEITFDVADFLRQFPTGPERAYDAVPGPSISDNTAYVGPQPGVVSQPANKIYLRGTINVDAAARHPYVGWSEGTPLKIIIDSDIIFQSDLNNTGTLEFNTPTVTPTTWDGGVKIDNDGVHLGKGGNSGGNSGQPAITIPSNLGPNVNEFFNRSNGKFFGGGGGGNNATLTASGGGGFPPTSSTAEGGYGQGSSIHSPSTGLNPVGRGGNAGRTYTGVFPSGTGPVSIAYSVPNDPDGGNNLTPGNPGNVNPVPPPNPLQQNLPGPAGGVGGGWGQGSPNGGSAGKAIDGFTYMGPTVFVNTAPAPSSLKGGTS